MIGDRDDRDDWGWGWASHTVPVGDGLARGRGVELEVGRGVAPLVHLVGWGQGGWGKGQTPPQT